MSFEVIFGIARVFVISVNSQSVCYQRERYFNLHFALQINCDSLLQITTHLVHTTAVITVPSVTDHTPWSSQRQTII